MRAHDLLRHNCSRWYDIRGLRREPRIGAGDRYTVVVGCLTLLAFVVGYAWAAGWLGAAGPVETSVPHCLLGGGTIGVSAALGIWFMS